MNEQLLHVLLAHIFIDSDLDGSPTWTSTAVCLPPRGVIYLCVAMVAPGILTSFFSNRFILPDSAHSLHNRQDAMKGSVIWVDKFASLLVYVSGYPLR